MSTHHPIPPPPTLIKLSNLSNPNLSLHVRWSCDLERIAAHVTPTSSNLPLWTRTKPSKTLTIPTPTPHPHTFGPTLSLV